MRYEVHIPGGVPYFSFVVDYDPTEEVPDLGITVDTALEWAAEVKKKLGLTGESHMVDAAVTMGAKRVPQARPPQATPPQQDNYWCKNCNGPAVLGNPVKTKRGPARPIKCDNGCMDGKWPLTVGWADA